MKYFKEEMSDYQISWKKKTLPHIIKKGWQNGRSYRHILPRSQHHENFYNPIRDELFNVKTGYLRINNIKPHTGIHNLLSSWALYQSLILNHNIKL